MPLDRKRLDAGQPGTAPQEQPRIPKKGYGSVKSNL
jgi:hypothetical protein